MIFVDSGALYALADKADTHHQGAVGCLEEVSQGSEVLTTSVLVVHEVWFLIDDRLGQKASSRFWEEMTSGSYPFLPLGPAELSKALGIQKKYASADFGLVDSATLALCEIHKIRKVFTFDRRHFSLFKPSFATHLDLLPEAF